MTAEAISGEKTANAPLSKYVRVVAQNLAMKIQMQRELSPNAKDGLILKTNGFLLKENQKIGL